MKRPTFLLIATIWCIAMACTPVAAQHPPPGQEWDTTNWQVVDIIGADTLWGFTLTPRQIADTIWTGVDLSWLPRDSVSNDDSLGLAEIWIAGIDTSNQCHGGPLVSPVGPWPCRWLYYDKLVPCPPKPRTYTIFQGVVFMDDAFSVTLEYSPCYKRDSIWHCAGDGTFALPTEDTTDNE